MVRQVDLRIGGVGAVKTVNISDFVGITDSITFSSNDEYDENNSPVVLKAGENLLDNMPTGVTVVNAPDVTASRDLYTVLVACNAVSVPTAHMYVRLGPGKYTMNAIRDYGGGGQDVNTAPWFNWIGAATVGKIQGVIGAHINPGEDLATQIVIGPTFVSSMGARSVVSPWTSKSPRQYALDAVPGTGQTLPITCLYWSGNSASAPMFWSGISFDGQNQTPLSVYSSGAQAAFGRNKAVPSPIAYNGFSIVKPKPGSRMQFCRFRGFGYALNSAPPFECGALQSNNSYMTFYRIDVDGRCAPEYNPTGLRSSGGFMWNKEYDIKMVDSIVHHTRRSGLAQNTNTHNQGEKHEIVNVAQFEIANVGTDDPYAIEVTNPMGFNAPNMEGMIGLFTLRRWKSNSYHSHIALTIPYSGSSGDIYTLPDRIIVYSEDFVTDDTSYNGCLRFSTGQSSKNVGGIIRYSPIWAALNADMDGAAAKYFDIRKGGVRLLPFKASLFNPAIHTPDKYYCLRTF